MDNDNSHYERTKIGAWFYSWVTAASVWVGRHEAIYWTLSFSWGIIMTLIGYLVSFFLLLGGKKRKKIGKARYQSVGSSWGGLTLGTSAFVDASESEYTLSHEYGHTHQNAVLGPFFIFLVAMPSAIRYWYRRAKNVYSPSYYAIWFEGSASDVGQKVLEEEE